MEEKNSKKIKEAFDALAIIAGGKIIDNEFIEISTDDNVSKTKLEHDPKEFYCISIDKGAFIIKSNNKISVTGNCHSEAGAWLFKTLLHECIALDLLTKSDIEKLKTIITETTVQILEHESRIIDMIFEKGHIKGITEKQLKNFVESRLDLCLEQLGFEKHFKPTYNPIKDWFYKNINSAKLHDFFLKQGSDYNRNWSEMGFKW